MSESDYWPWPNRREDIDYSSMSIEEVGELDVACVRAGLVEAVREMNPLSMNWAARQDKAVRSLETVRALWVEASGDRRVLLAHAWHRHMERIPIWKPVDAVMGDRSGWYGDGTGALSELVYLSCVSQYELARMLIGFSARWTAHTGRLAKAESGAVYPVLRVPPAEAKYGATKMGEWSEWIWKRFTRMEKRGGFVTNAPTGAELRLWRPMPELADMGWKKRVGRYGVGWEMELDSSFADALSIIDGWNAFNLCLRECQIRDLANEPLDFKLSGAGVARNGSERKAIKLFGNRTFALISDLIEEQLIRFSGTLVANVESRR